MNLKTTIFLVILAVACAALWWKGPGLAPRLRLAPKPVEVVDHGTAAELEKIAAGPITHIDIKRLEPKDGKPESQALVDLGNRNKGKTLELPGNWPVRQYEVRELLATLAHLKSRFYPIPLAKDADLKPYGLDPSQSPVKVEVESAGKKYALLFGQEEVKAGENPFLRSTYVRLDDKDELLRLGPDVAAVLGRPEDVYRRRQLFPEVERFRIPGGAPARGGAPTATTVMLLGDKAKRIEIDGPSGRFVLERVAPMPKPIVELDKPAAEALVTPDQIARSWVLVEPVRDRVDPAKLRTLLTALPELMVQQFDEKAVPWFKTGLMPTPIEKFLTQAATVPGLYGGGSPASVAMSAAFFSNPPAPVSKMTVTLDDGTSRTVYVGTVSHSTRRIERDPPMFPGQPPSQPRIVSEDFYYAKVGDNPIVFDLKDDRLKELFVLKPADATTKVVDELRDPTLVHFDVNQVSRIDIVQPAKDGGVKAAERRFELVKTKGDPNAMDTAAQQDRWDLVQPVKDPADTAAVTELLDFLKGMEARKANIVDVAPASLPAVVGVAGAIDPKLLLGLAPGTAKRITLTFGADTGLKPVTLLVGERDAKTNKRAVIVEGWPRINVVDDRAEANQVSRLDRQPSSYRSLKLFAPANKIGEIVVQRSATGMHPADGYTIVEQAGPRPKWSIAAPFKADSDFTATSRLATELGNLGSQKYVYDPNTDVPFKFSHWPTILTSLGIAEPLGEGIFGFNPPAVTVTLKFSEPKGAADVAIEIGRKRSDTEYYARLKGTTGVFVIPERVVKAIDQKPEDLVDKTLIRFGAAKPDVQAIRRSMGGQELEFTQNNSAQWEIAKPAPAKADQASVDELAQKLGELHAERIEAVTPKSLKEYGLDPPVATVTVEALEKTKLVEKTLLVGNPVDPTNPHGDRFVKAQGSTMVAVVPGSLADKLVAAPQKFRDLSLGGFITADKITMERGDRKITFVKGPTGWKVTEPLDAEAEDAELRDLHDNLAKLRAEELVDDKPTDLAKYGLDKPKVWRIFNGDREVMHLLVGNREKIGPDKQTEGFRTYAKLAKGTTVVLLDPLLTSELSHEYRKRALWDPVPPTQIKEVSVKAPDAKGSFTLVKGPTGWIDPQRPADRLSSEIVNDLLLTLGSLRVERYVVDKGANLAKYGLDRPRTIVVTAEDGKKRAILIGNLDGKRLDAKLDDPARTDVFLLSESDSASINRPRAEYSLPGKKDETKKDDPKKSKTEPKGKDKK